MTDTDGEPDISREIYIVSCKADAIEKCKIIRDKKRECLLDFIGDFFVRDEVHAACRLCGVHGTLSPFFNLYGTHNSYDEVTTVGYNHRIQADEDGDFICTECRGD
ncbi:MAG: hypothetical protein AAB534_01930 [Patescibacteria group bacterium]